MRLVFAVLFLALCGSIYANQALSAELSQIHDHPFGATVLAAISANLRAKTPIDDISILLQQILDGLLADSGALDSHYSTTKQTLTDAINNNNDLINGFQNNIDSLTTSRNQDEASKASKESTLSTVQESIRTTTDTLNTLIANYQSYIPNVEADIEDLESAIDACEKALAKMGTYQSATATSLLQVASSAQREIQSFSKQLDGMRSKLTKHGSIYGPLIHELVALTQNPESDKASKVVQLLNELLALLKKALSELQAQKATYESGYQTQKTQLENDLVSYQAQETQLKTDIDDLTTRINNANTNINSLEELKKAAEKVRDDAVAALQKLESDYATERPRYDKLIQIMRDLIKHFSDNVASVDDWTRQQVNGF